MQLTQEQYDIIRSSGNIKINAVAGSGKTTTVIEYAKTRPANSRILYLAFNKTVKTSAAKKFAQNGLHNVQVETAHSLAYRYVVYKSEYRINANGYKTNEIADLLNIRGNGEKHTEYVVANHINKFVAYFLNSDKERLEDLNYLDTISDPKTKVFVSSMYNYIKKQAVAFFDMMDNNEIEITHDFYLKKFQLSSPILPYDYILFDEGQDGSAAMLDVFLKQAAVKVIVGDTHQQIYGWRYAVNSLEKADFRTYYLSTSFRFSNDIANLAAAILKYKEHIGEHQSVKIIGKATEKDTKTKAVIARTNLGLLLKAIEYVTKKKEVRSIHFEGNINSYTYADEGASLYDILNLYNGNHPLIKDKLIKSMADMGELVDYIEKTEDVQLAIMVKIIKEYGNKIPEIIKAIKEKHVDDKENAEMIFSTVHRCKGMEYDTIQLVNDFITEEKLEKLRLDKKSVDANTAKINEEINMLYVAVTRTKNMLYIPETLMPKMFPVSAQIRVLKVVNEEDGKPVDSVATISKVVKSENQKEKSYPFDTIREKYKDAYKPWTAELDKQLEYLCCDGLETKELAKYFGRSTGAIRSRITKLGLETLFDDWSSVSTRIKNPNQY